MFNPSYTRPAGLLARTVLKGPVYRRGPVGQEPGVRIFGLAD